MRRPPGLDAVPKWRLVALALALLAFGTAGRVHALDPARPLTQYSIDFWRTTDGLPQNTITTVQQTRDGYLWIGTEEGLARFDGLVFTTFDTSNSPLRHNYIVCLYEDRAGALWVGTFNGGVARYQRGEFRIYGKADGLSSNGVSAIAEGADGSMWFGTTDAGLNQLRDGRITVFGAADGLPDDRVRDLVRDAEGSLWVGTDDGLARLRDGRFTVFRTGDGLPSNFISDLHAGGSGTLWIGTSSGLSRLQSGGFTNYGVRDGLPNANVHGLHFDANGNLWIGTDRGLTRLRAGHFESLGPQEALGAHSVLAMASDREGSLWVGLDGGALARLKDGKVLTIRSRDAGWRDNTSVVVGGQGGGLWLGGSGGEVSRFVDGAIHALPSRRALGNAHVRALASDGDLLWIGTDLGLHRRRGDRFEAVAGNGLPDAAVRAILRDRSGTLWIGTDGEGLARLEGGRFTVFREKDGLAGDRVRFIHEDRRGRLWIGSYGGLSLLEEGRWRAYGPAQGLPDVLVRSVYEDDGGVMWLGTYGGGLICFQDGRFTSFGSRQGLPSDIIYGIAEDGAHNLWMSGNKGIFRVNKRELAEVAAGTLAAVQALTLGVDDGLRGNECNGGNPAIWRQQDGTLWFPTLKGLVRVDPARLPVNTIPPPVVIESVTADGKTLALDGGAHLPPGRPRVEIRYAALSFVAPSRVRMSYRLEGFDSDWIEAGTRRTAYYTNLPPGQYTFRVKATNEDGMANDAGATISVSQEPRVYETNAFAFAMIACTVLAAFGFYRLRVAHLHRRERVLQGKVAEALANVKVLSGLLPVCASCKKIRDDKGYWQQIETFIRDHSEADFSHGVCPECVRRLYPDLADRILAKAGPKTN